MKILKNIILSFIKKSDQDTKLTPEQQKLILYINYGVFVILGTSCLLSLALIIAGVKDPNTYYWILGFALLYSTIPFFNKLQYYKFSKALILVLISIDLISWNLFVYQTPYNLFLPFIITIIFYRKLWIRIAAFFLFFTIYGFLAYYNQPNVLLDYVILDFSLLIFLFLLVLFLDNIVTKSNRKMSRSIHDLQDKNESLTKQQQLKKSEQFFTSFFENGQLGFVIINKIGDIININQTFATQIKISKSTLLNKNFLELNQLNQAFQSQFEPLLLGKIKHFRIEGKFINPNDTDLIADLMINGVYDTQGNFVEAIITVQDITTATQTNEKLKESESKFKVLFDNSPLGITIRDAETGKLLEANRNVFQKLGLTKEEFFEKSDLYLKGEGLGKLQKFIQELSTQEKNRMTIEKVFYTKSNQPVHVEMTRSKIVINGSPCLVTISKDITEKKQLEEERKMRYQETQTFFDALPISFLYLDTNHKILRVNDIIQNNFKAPLEGKYLTDVFPQFAHKKKSQADIFKSGVPTINRVEQFEIFGKIRWQKISRIPVKDENGAIKGLMIFSTDITAIKDAESALVLKNAELEHYIQTNLQLESFAYIASHDLKEPLRMVYSFTQLLNKKLKPHFDKDAEEYMQFILEGTKRMQYLLEDLLEYSTIGRKETGLELVDLNDTIYNVIQNLQIAIQEKQAEIHVANLPKLNAFPMQMIQLFQNLISNALKFIEPSKTAIININVTETLDNYTFSLSDNGIGIDDEYFEKIFLVFKRLHGKDNYKGTGIGLATCKKIIENHKGKIWLNSKIGIGTTFYFNIPKNA